MRKVITRETQKLVELKDVNIYDIFAYREQGKVYKLQLTSRDNGYVGGFAQLSYSFRNYNNQSEFYFERFTDAIRDAVNEGKQVYEFQDVNEFLDWAKEVYEG